MPSGRDVPISVDAYLANVPDFARPICAALRSLIRKTAPELREVIKWTTPCFEGRALVFGLGAFKQHVALTFFKGALLEDPEGLLTREGNAITRSVEFRSESDIRAASLKRLIKAAVALDADPEAKPVPRGRRPELPMPADLQKAIDADRKATGFWATLPPSAKRDFIEWIVEARRPETRAQRFEKILEMLRAGRRRHEEYRRC